MRPTGQTSHGLTKISWVVPSRAETPLPVEGSLIEWKCRKSRGRPLRFFTKSRTKKLSAVSTQQKTPESQPTIMVYESRHNNNNNNKSTTESTIETNVTPRNTIEKTNLAPRNTIEKTNATPRNTIEKTNVTPRGIIETNETRNETYSISSRSTPRTSNCDGGRSAPAQNRISLPTCVNEWDYGAPSGLPISKVERRRGYLQSEDRDVSLEYKRYLTASQP